MFTGIIQKIGRVEGVATGAESARFSINLGALAEGARLGDSVAVDGACLTIAALNSSVAVFDVSSETLRRTTLGALRVGAEVNLEPAMQAADRFGGHFVLGHVDDTGTIKRLHKAPGQVTLEVAAPATLIRQLVQKGSVAVDGISLTIAALTDESFAVAVIPHTLEHTTLRGKRVGDRVNLETDVIGKYVARYLAATRHSQKNGGITDAFLAEHGFA